MTLLNTADNVKLGARQVDRIYLGGNLAADYLERQVQRMFAGGVPGFMIDPTRMGYCYQDAARTTLVNAMGQGIGSPEDLSGNGCHPAQTTSTSRPLYQGYADLDGTDDGWVTPAIDFTGTDAITVIVACRMMSNAAVGLLLNLGNYSGAVPGSFMLRAPRTSGGRLGWYSRGSLPAGEVLTPNVYVAPRSIVISAGADISADTSFIRADGAQINSSAADQGTGTYSNGAVSIGRFGASRFTGGIYRAAVFGRLLTASEFAIAERWADQPLGTLP